MDHRIDPGAAGAEALLEYGDGEYRVMRPGTHVRCAVTGVVVPLDQLRYWSAERQEAYAGPEAVRARMAGEGR